MCRINVKVKHKQNTLFCFEVVFLYWVFFLYGDFSDGQTNNLVNTQTDTNRRPVLQPPPHYITVSANGEQDVSQSRGWGTGSGGVSLNSWECLIVFRGPPRDQYIILIAIN